MKRDATLVPSSCHGLHRLAGQKGEYKNVKVACGSMR